MRVETIEFQGVRYRRYPDSERSHLRDYYWAGPADRMKGADCLHRDIYRACHGEIPQGSHVHHKDGNPLNNDPANLALLTVVEHRAEHEAPCSPEQRAHLDRVRPLASAWHKSPEGRAWHSEISRRPKRSQARAGCAWCAAPYVSKTSASLYCSNRCTSAARRASGLDDETRRCAWCQAEFTCNRYAKTVTCSGSCGSARGNARRREQAVSSV